MELKKLSASAMEVLEKCESRWVAEQKLVRGAAEQGEAARVGTITHTALELYVKKTILSDEMDPTPATMEVLVMKAYQMVTGKLDDSDEYKDALEMAMRWQKRTLFEGFQVISCEEHGSFQVKTSQGEIPFNYYFDRLDYLGNGHYRVVDYKTIGRPLAPMEVYEKLQAKVYALAVKIHYPDAEKVHVLFDMLRWEGYSGTSFSRDDCVQTWRRIKAAAEKAIAITDPDEVPETLNDTCIFCVKKSSCTALLANQAAGGVHMFNLEEKVRVRALAKIQNAATKKLLDELDREIINEMSQKGQTSIQTEGVTGKLASRNSRAIDPERVKAVIGDEAFARYGDVSLSMAGLDALLKDPDIPAEARARVESLIIHEQGKIYLDTRIKP